MKSDTPAILDLARANVPPRDIAEQLEISIERVYNVCHWHRSEGHDVPVYQGRENQRIGRVLIKPEVLEALRRHAVPRGLTVRQLAAEVVMAVVEGDLVNAVLDDEVARHG